MKNSMKDILLTVYKFLTNRILILMIVLFGLFYYLCTGIFDLQIVNGQDYQPPAKQVRTKTISVNAPRGEIYDRYGRPLAVNETAYTVKFNTIVSVGNLGEVMARFVKLMNKNGEELIDDFSISADEPYVFLLNNNEDREKKWKRDMDIDESFDAQQSYEYLLEFFEISPELSRQEQRQVVSLCSAVYMERYNLNPVTFSMGIKPETMAALEENNQDFPGIYIDVDYLRHYPEADYVAHMVGYIRKISADELNDKANEGYGYTASDLYGKDGIELAEEHYLKGEKGQMTVEIDQSSGRRLASVTTLDPVPGDDVFLTIDLELQKFVVDTLEDKLSEILINKMLGKSTKEKPLTAQDIVCGLISSNNISAEKIMQSDEDSVSYAVKEYVLKNGNLDTTDKNYAADLKKYVSDTVSSGKISSNQMIGVMAEQGLVTVTEDEMALIKKNRLVSITFLVSKIESRELTPQMINLNPSSAAAIVVNVNDGSVLAAANYPNYDNNQFVNNFNNEYFQKVNNDPTLPQINRVFKSPFPPGSTFKMITAIAGLENGVITTRSTIHDGATFTKAGEPYASCAVAPGSHGTINVSRALEVSCNYFFFETVYRLGNTKDNTRLEGIAKLNEYMEKFGLNDLAGVEIDELYSSREPGRSNISSPALKEYTETTAAENRGEKAAAWQTRWTDGDTIRTAIGQSLNAYTVANMGKYIATLANGGTRYKMHLVDKIVSSDGKLGYKSAPEIEEVIQIKPENWQAVYEGMALAAHGSAGTARSIFKDFPMKIAAKTGTTQQDKSGNDHASFACFAPYDNAEIAVYVVIPYGNTQTTTSPAADVARQILTEYFGLEKEAERLMMDNSLAM